MKADLAKDYEEYLVDIVDNSLDELQELGFDLLELDKLEKQLPTLQALIHIKILFNKYLDRAIDAETILLGKRLEERGEMTNEN